MALCTLAVAGVRAGRRGVGGAAGGVGAAGRVTRRRPGRDPLVRAASETWTTWTDHLRLMARYLGRRPAGSLESKGPGRVAADAGDPVRAGVGGQRVAHAREVPRHKTFDRLAHEFTGGRRGGLGGLLVVDSLIGMTRLRWLGEGRWKCLQVSLGRPRHRLARVAACWWESRDRTNETHQ